MLYLMNNKLFIKDMKSKFGTLALVRGKYEISDKTVCLQIGRTYLECASVSQTELQKMKTE
jgi:hypothetical protein